MNKVRILHTADLHIGAECSYLVTKAKSRQYETLLTFEKIVSICNQNEVDLLLIAGDLLESNHIEPALIDGVFNALASLEKTRAIIALGNHDPLTADSPFVLRELPKNVYVFKSNDSVFTFDDIKCRIYGASFDGVYNSGKERFEIDTTEDDYFNLCVLHGETRSDMNGVYRPITPDFVKHSGMDYIALGHIHARSQIRYVGKTAVAYCGCPEGQGFDESGEKGVYMGDVSKGDIALNFIPTAKRTHYRVDVDVTEKEDIYEAVISAIKEKSENYSENYFRISLIGSRADETPIDLDELNARVSANVEFLKLKDNTRAGIDLNQLANEKTLKGYFTNMMLKKIEAANDDEKEKYSYALELGLKAFSEEVPYCED